MPFEQFLQVKNGFEFQLEEFDKIIELVKDQAPDNSVNRYIGCLALRKLLSVQDSPPFKQTVQRGVVATLIANAHCTDFS